LIDLDDDGIDELMAGETNWLDLNGVAGRQRLRIGYRMV
jgi:hypothetical protein